MDNKKKIMKLIKYYLLIAILFNLMVFMYHSKYLKHITDVLKISTNEEFFLDANEQNKVDRDLEEIIEEKITESNIGKEINKKTFIEKVKDIIPNRPQNDSTNNNGNEDHEDDMILSMLEGNNTFEEINELDIFKDAYNDELKMDIIYPGVSGKYNFRVENNNKETLSYNLEFLVESLKDVNMKYYILRNGISLTDTENQYFDISVFDLKNLKVNAKSSDEYTIYWKWIDNDSKDVNASDKIDRAVYKLKIRGTM